jgi:hypothetical protein
MSPVASCQEFRLAVAQRMSEQAYQELVLSGAKGAWELHDGRLVAKPAVTCSWFALHMASRCAVGQAC